MGTVVVPGSSLRPGFIGYFASTPFPDAICSADADRSFNVTLGDGSGGRGHGTTP